MMVFCKRLIRGTPVSLAKGVPCVSRLQGSWLYWCVRHGVDAGGFLHWQFTVQSRHGTSLKAIGNRAASARAIFERVRPCGQRRQQVRIHLGPRRDCDRRRPGRAPRTRFSTTSRRFASFSTRAPSSGGTSVAEPQVYRHTGGRLAHCELVRPPSAPKRRTSSKLGIEFATM